MLVSPIVVIQSGTYLGYLFTLGLGLLFLTAVCSGVRTGRRGRLFVAGLLIGWIFMTRPFDAVLWAVGVVVVLAWTHRAEPARLLRAAVPLGLGFLPLLVATLAYNAHVTGAATQFPITAADPLDTFGFGLRRIMPTFGPADYTVVQAVRSTGKQAALLPIFLAGSYVLGGLALWGMWRARRDPRTQVLIATAIAFPLGYFFFWGMFVSSSTMPLSGPIYFIPVYPILAILGGREILRLWDDPTRGRGRARRRDGGAHDPGRDRPHRRQPSDQRGADPVAAEQRVDPRALARLPVALGRLPDVPQPVLVEPREPRRSRPLRGRPRRAELPAHGRVSRPDAVRAAHVDPADRRGPERPSGHTADHAHADPGGARAGDRAAHPGALGRDAGRGPLLPARAGAVVDGWPAADPAAPRATVRIRAGCVDPSARVVARAAGCSRYASPGAARSPSASARVRPPPRRPGTRCTARTCTTGCGRARWSCSSRSIRSGGACYGRSHRWFAVAPGVRSRGLPRHESRSPEEMMSQPDAAPANASSVVIIGAGPAGLTAAYQLAKRGVRATILEADDIVGGISRTVERDGWRFDIGGHRFFTKVQEVDDLWFEILGPDEFLQRPRMSRILYRGKLYDYPLKPLNVVRNIGPFEAVRCVGSYAWVRVRPPEDTSNLEGFYISQFGRRLYEHFFRRYNEKVWGVPTTRDVGRLRRPALEGHVAHDRDRRCVDAQGGQGPAGEGRAGHVADRVVQLPEVRARADVGAVRRDRHGGRERSRPRRRGRSHPPPCRRRVRGGCRRRRSARSRSRPTT